jgi:hypothetical protein
LRIFGEEKLADCICFLRKDGAYESPIVFTPWHIGSRERLGTRAHAGDNEGGDY